MKKIVNTFVRSLASTAITCTTIGVILVTGSLIERAGRGLSAGQTVVLASYMWIITFLPFALYSWAHNIVIKWLASRSARHGLIFHYAIGLILAAIILMAILVYDIESYGINARMFDHFVVDNMLFAIFVVILIPINYLLMPRAVFPGTAND